MLEENVVTIVLMVIGILRGRSGQLTKGLSTIKINKLYKFFQCETIIT